MKIIRQGIRPQDRLYRGICSNCATEVEFTEGEGNRSPDQRDNGAVSVECPTCSCMIWGRPHHGGGYAMKALPAHFYRDPAQSLILREEQTCKGCRFRRVVDDLLQCTHGKVADPLREDRCTEYEERE